MTGLVTWLREQIAEDRRAAEAAADRDNDWWWDKPESPAEAHIANWAPVRVTAECDAKERLVDQHNERYLGPELWGQHRLTPEGAERDAPTGGSLYQCPTCDHVDSDDDDPLGHLGEGCPTLRLLALPYADRPGYRDEWRLDAP